MTHLPYIIAAYGIAVICISSLAIHSWTRLKRAQKKLIALQQTQQNSKSCHEA
ncbi:heme exporter protein CcmD [Commensalibacter oyaizuii]|uniref:Heme exporter protein D n=1 Tax=Commensalibacter oyaizuii TaxID=3043873 RepID=A0ABT6PYA5_9PROT|nr:heme exporter protein CcmD [Commensalibacter sp. TBRC 16381]MDI2089832.1 heme exporter protein CcmD [Commensalibacter sp. TBRC 16381]